MGEDKIEKTLHCHDRIMQRCYRKSCSREQKTAAAIPSVPVVAGEFWPTAHKRHGTGRLVTQHDL